MAANRYLAFAFAATLGGCSSVTTLLHGSSEPLRPTEPGAIIGSALVSDWKTEDEIRMFLTEPCSSRGMATIVEAEYARRGEHRYDFTCM